MTTPSSPFTAINGAHLFADLVLLQRDELQIADTHFRADAQHALNDALAIFSSPVHTTASVADFNADIHALNVELVGISAATHHYYQPLFTI